MESIRRLGAFISVYFISFSDISDEASDSDDQVVQGIISGDASRLNELTKIDINKPLHFLQKRFTPLQWACVFEQIEIVNLLIDDKNADVNRQEGNGPSALHLAVELGHDKIVQLLIGKGAAVDCKIRGTGVSPLHIASQNGHELIAQSLIDAKATVDMQTSDTSEFDRAARLGTDSDETGTPLSVAKTTLLNLQKCHFGDDKSNRAIVKSTTHRQVENSNLPVIGKVTALYIAAQNGHHMVVKALTKAKANVGLQTADGMSALHIASQKGHHKVVKALLKAGSSANVGAPNNVTALHIAAENGHVLTVRTLLKGKASVNSVTQNEGMTPLHIASQNGHCKVVTALIKASTSVTIKARNGMSALHIASQNGHHKVVKALLKAGLLVDVFAPNDVTALHIAAENDHVLTVRTLLKAKASVNSVTQNERMTPLHFASQNGHCKVVMALIKASASVTIKAQNGMSALDFALKNDHTAVQNELKKALFQGPEIIFAYIASHKTQADEEVQSNESEDVNAPRTDAPQINSDGQEVTKRARNDCHTIDSHQVRFRCKEFCVEYLPSTKELIERKRQPLRYIDVEICFRFHPKGFADIDAVYLVGNCPELGNSRTLKTELLSSETSEIAAYLQTVRLSALIEPSGRIVNLAGKEFDVRLAVYTESERNWKSDTRAINEQFIFDRTRMSSAQFLIKIDATIPSSKEIGFRVCPIIPTLVQVRISDRVIGTDCQEISVSNSFYPDVLKYSRNCDPDAPALVRSIIGTATLANLEGILVSPKGDPLTVTVDDSHIEDAIPIELKVVDNVPTAMFLIDITLFDECKEWTTYPMMNVILHIRVPEPEDWNSNDDDRMQLRSNWDGNTRLKLKAVRNFCKKHSNQDDVAQSDSQCKSCVNCLQNSVTIPVVVQPNLLLKCFAPAELQEFQFTLERTSRKSEGDPQEVFNESETHSLWLSAGRDKKLHELDVFVAFDRRPEFSAPWFAGKRDRLLTDFANFLGNVKSLGSSMRTLSRVKEIYARMLVPGISDDGSYTNCVHDDPQKWFDIWGDDLDGENDEYFLLPKSAITYCQLRQMKFPDSGDARAEVIERLRLKYLDRQDKIVKKIRDAGFHPELTDQLRSTETDTFASGLVAVANRIDEISDENLLRLLLQNSAAIVRGRIEARFLGDKVHRGCLVAKAWFALVMAAWQRLRMLKGEQLEDEKTAFENSVREENVPVPKFYTWHACWA